MQLTARRVDQLWTKAEWSSQPHCLERPSQYYIHYHRHQGKSCKLTIFTMIHSYPLNITTINTDTRVNVGRDACSSHPKGKNPRPKPFAGARRRPLFRGWIAKPLITFWEYILVIKPSHTAPLPCPVRPQSINWLRALAKCQGFTRWPLNTPNCNLAECNHGANSEI